MRVSVLSESGINKMESEDAVIVNNLIIREAWENIEIDQMEIVGIADGVGGNAGGKEAADFLLKKLISLDKEFDNKTELSLKMKMINNELIEEAKTNILKSKMATVYSGIIANQNRYYTIHIGNTRIYAKQGRFLNCLTEDQTMKALHERNGNYGAADKCNPSEIYSCFGGGEPKLFQYMEIAEIDNDLLDSSVIITSDGIHEYVSIGFIEKLMNDNLEDETLLRKISDEALSNGSQDDRSIVIIHIK